VTLYGHNTQTKNFLLNIETQSKSIKVSKFLKPATKTKFDLMFPSSNLVDLFQVEISDVRITSIFGFTDKD
jgi:hypothetical protein